MKNIQFIFVFAFIASLYACQDSSVLVMADNPTTREIKLKFDNDYGVYIRPSQQEPIYFKPGNAIVYCDGERVGEITIEAGKEYLLNPTLSRYIIEEVGFGAGGAFAQRYGKTNSSPKDKYPKGQIPLNWAVFDSVEYSGLFIDTNDLLIERIWELGAKQKLDKQVKVSQGVLYTSKIKIFREYFFIKYHELWKYKEKKADEKTNSEE